MRDLKRLLSYLGPYKIDMVIGAILVLVETCFELVIPILMADLIDVGVMNQDVTFIEPPTAGAPGFGRRNMSGFRNMPSPILITLRPPLWLPG